MWVKICGITRLEDAESAAWFGADAVGFIFADSPRMVTPERAREISRRMPEGPAKVGVFVNSPLDEVKETVEYCGLDIVQLHGDEPPGYCSMLGCDVIKAFRTNGTVEFSGVADYRCHALLFDSDKSEGKAPDEGRDWKMLRLLEGKARVIVAGGLRPENVADAVRDARPYGVDTSSGIESAPGVKDPVLMYRFIEKARKAGYEVRS